MRWMQLLRVGRGCIEFSQVGMGVLRWVSKTRLDRNIIQIFIAEVAARFSAMTTSTDFEISDLFKL